MSRFALAVVAAALAVAFAALIGWAHARPGAVPPLFWAATLAAWAAAWWLNHRLASMPDRRETPRLRDILSPLPVSYTHLTLPTILRV